MRAASLGQHGCWVAGMALVGLGIAVWLLVPQAQSDVQNGTKEPPAKEEAPKLTHAQSEEEPKPAAGYQLVKDGSGSLTLEVPSGWKTTIGEYAEARDGPESSWSAFGGKDLSSSITASANLNAWHNTCSPVTPGIYIAASRGLAQKYTDDKLVVSGPNDFSKGCEAGSRQDLSRSSYPGKMQTWNCDGGTFLTLAAAPKSRDCVVLAEIGMYSEADRKSAEHILDTFEVDCSKTD